MENLNTVIANVEVERYVLGSMLSDPEIALQVIDAFNDDDFYLEKHQIIIKTFKSLIKAREELSVVAISEEIKRSKKLEVVGGLEYLHDLIIEVPFVDEIDAYIRIIKEKAALRKLRDVGKKIYDAVNKGEEKIEDIITNSDKAIQNIVKDRSSSAFISMDNALEKTFEIIEEKVNKPENDNIILTGYEQVDEALHGLGRGALIILAARPSIGKSTFALNIAQNVAESKKSVALFSLEMGYDQLVTKMLSTTASLNMDKIITGKLSSDEMSRLLVSKDKLSNYKIFFNDESLSGLSAIRKKCLQLKRETGLDLIVIDYLQLLSQDDKDKGRGNRSEVVGDISRGLKTMARSLDVPILALSQLNRSVEKQDRADKTPMLSDLRESGSIEQDADVVMFLHRERATDEQKKVKSSKTDLIIAKNRNGETKTVKLIFNGALSKFSSYEEEE